MHSILADLVAEQQALDQYLQTKPEREWKTGTPAEGWDVKDQVSHLAWSEEFALDAITNGGARLTEAAEYDSPDKFTLAGVERGRNMRSQEVIEWWRGARAGVVDALSRTDPSARIPWFAQPMSARSFATARLMETWAHGLDVHHAFYDEPEDTTRLKHVAFLAWKALPYAFQYADLDYETPVRVEVIGPDYSKWVYGPDDTDQVIRGRAGEWCRVAVRRLDAADTSLRAQGDVAEAALRVARAYV